MMGNGHPSELSVVDPLCEVQRCATSAFRGEVHNGFHASSVDQSLCMQDCIPGSSSCTRRKNPSILAGSSKQLFNFSCSQSIFLTTGMGSGRKRYFEASLTRVGLIFIAEAICKAISSALNISEFVQLLSHVIYGQSIHSRWYTSLLIFRDGYQN